MQKKVPYVAQLGNMDCSIACMTMLFRYYGLDVDIVDVGQVVHIGRDGVNLTQLKQATQQFGFKCTAYRSAHCRTGTGSDHPELLRRLPQQEPDPQTSGKHTRHILLRTPAVLHCCRSHTA